MRTSVLYTALAVAFVGIACSDDTTAPATGFHANLNGTQEVPAVSTAGTATATFALTAGRDSATYTVSITAPVGAAVTQSHIHLAAVGVNGGISVWLCGTTAFPGPAGTPTCAAGTSIGVLATGKVAVSAAAVNAMRAFGGYANVHTTANSGGEIRGQIVPNAP